jgi:hypothetical protein
MDSSQIDAALTVRVLIHADSDVDPDDDSRLASGLRSELNELDVESVEFAFDRTSSAGAKGDPVTVGALIVALSAAGGVLPNVIGVVREWLNRQSGCHRVSVCIDGDTIELDRATEDEQHELVDAFVQKHIRR